MKKRAIISLLVTCIVVSFILPALATEIGVNAGPSAALHAAAKAAADPGAEDDPEPDATDSAEPEPSSFIYLDGVPQFVEYELRGGTTYVTVSSFVAMADPQAVVEEENGVVTVSSARVERVMDAEGNPTDVVWETLSMTVSTKVDYITANDRYLYAKNSITTVNGCVAVPIRRLALVFNLDVSYDSAAKAVLLTHAEGRGSYIEPGDSYYDADALYWLSHIINAESGDQILEGKIAVGNVVMNRVNSPTFPNTIYAVLHQPNQFSPIANGTIRLTPNSQSVLAAKLVMDGAVVMPTALYFNMVGLRSWAALNRPYVTTIGGHAFYA